MNCEHHSHKVRERFRCCRCGAEFVIGIGWVERHGKQLKVTRCASA